jgi:hypothetical protein
MEGGRAEGPGDEFLVGSDLELNEAIKIILGSAGFQVEDLEVIRMVERAMRKKLAVIASNCHFCYGGSQDEAQSKFLQLSQLKLALAEEHIRVDRPEFILEQPQSKMNTRRSKQTK